MASERKKGRKGQGGASDSGLVRSNGWSMLSLDDLRRDIGQAIHEAEDVV